jgi:phosphoglycolate phosphatase
MKKPDSVIFDWDNTLCNTIPIIDSCLEELCILSGKGKEFIKEIKKFSGISMKDFFPILFGNKWQEFGDLYLSLYDKKQTDMLDLMPNSKKILDFFYDKKIPLFILSNKTSSNLKKEVNQLNVNKYFTNIVGSGDAKFDKPHPESVRFIFQNSTLSPKKNHTWLIGDTEVDLKCAIDSHHKPILINKSPSKKSLKMIEENSQIEYFLDINGLYQKIYHWIF